MLGLLFVLVGALLAAFAIGLYVAVTLGVIAIGIGELFSERSMLDMLSRIPWNATTNTTLVALPLFILMGEILLRSGVTDGMYHALSRWFGRLPGALLHTNVAACAIFACVSGSSAATAATIGGVALPFMRRRNYSNRYVLGSLAAGGTLGILIPPSIVMIVYGVLAEESIGRLYMAGIVPGLLMTLMFMAVIFIAAKLNPAISPMEPPSTWREKIAGLTALLPMLALMFLVLGTIYVGIATATEAAAFGSVGAFIIALINRRVDAQMLRDTFIATAATTSMIVFILIGAFLLQFTLTFLGLPLALTKWVTGLGLSPMAFVLVMCGLYLVLGMFMESLSMVVITIPVILPLLKSLHINLVWFGIIIVILVEAALITPPVGMNLFVMQGISDRVGGPGIRRPHDIYFGIAPFLLAMIITLVLIILFPDIALWLVRTAKGA